MHGITRFHAFKYDEERVTHALNSAITRGQGRYVIFVAESSQGAIVGALMAVLEQHIFSDELTASIVHYDVLPESRMGGWGLRLLRALETWAKNRSAVEINFGINSGHTTGASSKFARRMGFIPVGLNYTKQLG